MKLSFVLITLNEADNLPRALRSCAALADEIILLDSGSTDATARIAADFGARFQHQDWLGYVGQKNLALSLATHDWVFSLDADEALSAELAAEISAFKQASIPDDLSGCSMPRCVFYEGRWIRHGDWYPDRLTRLFRKSRAHFAGGKVHERLELTGPVRPLTGDLHHHSFRDAADHRARGEKYARLWAETQFELGRRAGPLAPYAHAAFRWFRACILKRGFLDGVAGWHIAILSAREVALKYRLLRELNRAHSATLKSEVRGKTD
jgi:glycosyltransferase involved in cell wall biosynthesis